MKIGILIKLNQTTRIAITVEGVVVDPPIGKLHEAYWLTASPEPAEIHNTASWAGVLTKCFSIPRNIDIKRGRQLVERLERAIPAEIRVPGRTIERSLALLTNDIYKTCNLPSEVAQRFLNHIKWSEGDRISDVLHTQENAEGDILSHPFYLPMTFRYSIADIGEILPGRMTLFRSVFYEMGDVVFSGWVADAQYAALKKQCDDVETSAVIVFNDNVVCKIENHPIYQGFNDLSKTVSEPVDFHRIARMFLTDLRTSKGELTPVAMILRGQRWVTSFRMAMDLARCGFIVKKIECECVAIDAEGVTE